MRSSRLPTIEAVDDALSGSAASHAKTSRARRRQHQSYDQFTSLALTRLNYYYQQFVHDYHHIVDDDDFNGGKKRYVPPLVVATKGPSFELAARSKDLAPDSARDPVDCSRFFNLARRSDSISVSISPRRPPVQYVSVKLEPGPGTYSPRFQFLHANTTSNVLDLDDIPGRDPVISRNNRSDLGPGTYDIPPLQKISSYIPRFDRITTREQHSRCDDDIPGPGTYSPKPMTMNIQAPKYLTMSPRKLIVSDQVDSDTPGPGSYNLEAAHLFNDRGFTFPVDDRRLDYVYPAEDRNGGAQTGRKKTKSQLIVPRKDFIASNLRVLTNQQRKFIAEENCVQRKKHYEEIMQRCRYQRNVSARIAERQADRFNRKMFRKHWLVILVQGAFCGRMKVTLQEYRKCVEVNQGILVRRTNLIMTLRKYGRAFKRHLQLKRTQRSIVLIKQFFAETEMLARSYAVAMIRNFRKTVTTLQRFWLNQLVKMEHQILAMLKQWNRYEAYSKARSKSPDRSGPDLSLESVIVYTSLRAFRGSLNQRIVARILNIDDSSSVAPLRRLNQNQTKIAVLRGFLIQRRRDYYRKLCQWKLQHQQWCIEKRSKDSTMDKARKIIQGESGIDTIEIEKEFKSTFPRPFFSILLSNAELTELVRQSHLEYRKMNIRDKRKVRLRAPNRLSIISQTSNNSHI